MRPNDFSSSRFYCCFVYLFCLLSKHPHDIRGLRFLPEFPQRKVLHLSKHPIQSLNHLYLYFYDHKSICNALRYHDLLTVLYPTPIHVVVLSHHGDTPECKNICLYSRKKQEPGNISRRSHLYHLHRDYHLISPIFYL